MTIHYLEDMGRKNEYFCYTREECLDAFAKKMEILSNFATFQRKKMLRMTIDETQICKSFLLVP